MSLPDQSHVRRGFTLTELLVVIAIIAILAALASVGIMTAMNKARATAIKTELDQLDAAMKRYKDTYGSYPPCNLAFLDTTTADANERTRRRQVVKQHLAMAFPRYAPSDARLQQDLLAAGIDLYHFRPDQALVFWLQGFSSDPMNPILSVDSRFIDPATGNVDRSPTAPPPQKRNNDFFAFDTTRLAYVDSSGGTVLNPAPSYFPANARLTVNQTTKAFPSEFAGGGVPIVYFDSRNYGTAPVVGGNEARPLTFNSTSPALFADAGYAFPYWQDKNGNGTTNQVADQSSQEDWINPDSFQLIAAGVDAKYSFASPPPSLPIDAHLFPTGTRIDVITEGDNAVNFTSKSRLGDDLP
jgi:prepilin-type N-terminal cleavage/methylation domain-containing protein